MEIPTQVTRPANGLPAVHTSGVRSAFDLANQSPPETHELPSTTPSQERLLHALIAAGGIQDADALRESMLEHMTNKALHNAIYNAKKANRLRKVGNAFEITQSGRTHLDKANSGRERDEKFMQPAMNSADQSDSHIPKTMDSATNLRWAKWSDGAFVLQRGECVIELTPDEFKALSASMGV